MRILSMTATFGKLEHAKLTLEPGLNIIEAPNEWGKSTWCAFLVNMLYGLDTRSRSSATALADKDRYAPWSGAAMSGRMEIEWNGRNITIERSSKGRVPMGEFRAYETDTGVDVPELNATNCGQQLLGVERSVFVRAGFLRAGQMPVTQDDALRRRLNNLVTTGDESGTADKLGQTLKDLKNKCRYNNAGLLPQAEAERDGLRRQLQDLHDLQSQTQTTQKQQQELKEQIARLENHKVALEYAAHEENIRQVEAAEENLAKINALVEQLQSQCDTLPSKSAAQGQLEALQDLQTQKQAVLAQPIDDLPQPPENKGDPAQAVEAAAADQARYAALQAQVAKKNTIMDILLAILTLGILPILRNKKKQACKDQMEAIAARYPGLTPDLWISHAQSYAQRHREYAQQVALRQEKLEQRQQQMQQLDKKLQALAGEQSIDAYRLQLQTVLQTFEKLEQAKLEQSRSESHVQTLRSMVRHVEAPTQKDELTLDKAQTEQALVQARFRQQQLQLQMGQTMGQAESLGSESLLKARLDTLNRRIARLEDTFHALELAQEALYQATTALQRRFAPRIAQQAQELFGKLTDGRYEKVLLAEDLTLSASAKEEDTLHNAQWRSDGTADQLYLALRLAVARELTPHAPLVLDDAFVRFDDTRLKNAMAILREETETKQVILFTCHSREQQANA